MSGRPASGNRRSDPRLALLDAILRRVLYLASYFGISADQLATRLRAVSDSGYIPAPRAIGLAGRTYAEVHAGPEVLQSWTRNLDFLDANGKPRPLPQRGTAPSFASLVGGCAPRVDPDTVLEDLLAAEAVRFNDGGQIEPVLHSLVFNGSERRAELGLYSVENLLSTVQLNVEKAPQTGAFQREAVCIRFDRRQLPRAYRHLSQQCLAGLGHADDWLNSYTMAPDARPQDTVTVVVGTYMTVRD